MNLFRYEQHEKDKTETRYDPEQELYIGSVSRHKKDGSLQGYLVCIEKPYEEYLYIIFKKYYHREVAEQSVICDYQLGNYKAL